MTSILEKYVFNDCVAGFPLSDFICGEKHKQKMLGGGTVTVAESDDAGTKRVEHLVIPVGLVSFSTTHIEPNLFRYNEKNKNNDKLADVISDDLFDKLLMSVTKQKSKGHKNIGTKKNKELPTHGTKRKMPTSE